MLVIFLLEKAASKYLKMPFCVRAVSDQLCNANGLSAQVERDELAILPNFGETVELLQAVVFVLCETLMQLVEVRSCKKNKRTHDRKAVMWQRKSCENG